METFKKTGTQTFALLVAIIIGFSIFSAVQLKLIQIHALNVNETNKSLTTVPSEKIPSISTPGEKTFYIFTSEVENVDENKLKVPGDSFSVHTLVVNKGDKVTVHFYNVDDVKTERHSFTIGDPYKVDRNATFTADHSGLFTYYYRYHVQVMTGQLLVLP